MGGHGLIDMRTQTQRVVDFRAHWYGVLTGWADATFELCDALLCAPAPVSSVPALSLEPVFRRSHGSLYKALARGGIDIEAMRDLLVANRPAGWPLVFAVTPPPGRVVTPRPAPSVGSTTPHPSIRPGSRSWPAGRISGWPNWVGKATPGPLHSMWCASGPTMRA